MRRPKNMAGPELGTQETHPHAVPSRELGGLCDRRERGRKGARVTENWGGQVMAKTPGRGQWL